MPTPSLHTINAPKRDATRPEFDVQIRPLTVEDVAWVSPLADGAFARFETDYGDAVARWLADPTVEGWAAVDDVGPLGFVLVGSVGLVGEGRPRVVDVLAIAVDARARRQGVGRRLLARVVELARRDGGVREVRLTVAAENAEARALFAQAGFVVDREDDGAFGLGQRAVRMRLSGTRRGPARGR